jgi:hypothetical protein
MVVLLDPLSHLPTRATLTGVFSLFSAARLLLTGPVAIRPYLSVGG